MKGTLSGKSGVRTQHSRRPTPTPRSPRLLSTPQRPRSPSYCEPRLDKQHVCPASGSCTRTPSRATTTAPRRHSRSLLSCTATSVETDLSYSSPPIVILLPRPSPPCVFDTTPPDPISKNRSETPTPPRLTSRLRRQEPCAAICCLL